MKKRATILALLLCLSVSPAEAGVKEVAGKVGHGVKKAAMLPLYLLGGAGAGLVTWWHIGGRESEFGDALRGGKF